MADAIQRREIGKRWREFTDETSMHGLGVERKEILDTLATSLGFDVKIGGMGGGGGGMGGGGGGMGGGGGGNGGPQMPQGGGAGLPKPKGPPKGKGPLGKDGKARDTDEDYTKLEDAIRAISELDDSLRFELGHQIEDMLLGCRFNGYECHATEFQRFYNYQFGNCYTFNVRSDDDVRKKTRLEWDDDSVSGRLHVHRTGPMYGLTLKLNVEQSEYSEVTSEFAGIKVVVHDPHVMPFPEDQGYRVTPGMASSIALRQVHISRQDPPHGDCQNLTHEEMLVRNVYADYQSHINYSTTACAKTCYQQHMVAKCRCADPAVPYDKTYEAIKPFWGSNAEIEACDYTSDTHSTCADEVFSGFLMNDLNCSSKLVDGTYYCPPMCIETSYEASTSMALWPSDERALPILEDMMETSKPAKGEMERITRRILINQFSAGTIPEEDVDTLMELAGEKCLSELTSVSPKLNALVAGRILQLGGMGGGGPGGGGPGGGGQGGGEEDECDLSHHRSEGINFKINEDNEELEEALVAFVRKNVLLVDVYFLELNYETLTVEEAYDIPSLIADFGGQTGLWLGLSMISLVEFLELVWDLCALLCCFRHPDQKFKHPAMVHPHHGIIQTGHNSPPRGNDVEFYNGY